MRPSLTPVLFCLCLPLLGQVPQITIAEGASATALSLRVLLESAPQGPGTLLLKDLEFLPIELTNRGSQHDLRTDRARRIERDGIVRVELPGNGRLLRYRLRGGDRHGFLLVLPDGSARVVLELSGTGSTGKDTPFADRCGVAPDGKAAAFTTLAGGLFVARLDGQNFASTGQPSRPILGVTGADALSVCVGKSVVFFQNANRVWRCPLADGGLPLDISPQPLPATLKDLMAQSGDGTTIVFLAGATKNTMQLWLARETGVSVALPPPPSKYEEPSYLPELAGGSRLALNDSGSRLLYCDGQIRDELFLLDIGGVSTTVAMTADTNFQPYIGTIILPVFSANVVTVAIGDPGKFDVYTAATGQPLVNNATQTGGNTVRPFGTGALVPTGAWLGSTGQVHVADVDAANLKSLRSIDPLSSTSIARVSGLLQDPVVGSAWTDQPDLLVSTQLGDRFYLGDSFAPLLFAPVGLTLAPSIHSPGSTYSMFRVSAGASLHVPVLVAPGLGILTLGTDSSPQTFAITITGSLVLNSSAGPIFVSPAGIATLPAAGSVRHILSGAGA